MGEIERDHLSARSWMLIRRATSIEKHAPTIVLLNTHTYSTIPVTRRHVTGSLGEKKDCGMCVL